MDHIDTVNSVCKCDIYIPRADNIGDKSREYAESLAKADCLKKCPPPDVLDKLEVTAKAIAKAEEEAGLESPEIDEEDDDGTIKDIADSDF